jgi:hypothetical protein
MKGVVDGPATADERRGAIEASDKPSCLVLDFTGDSGKHKIVSVANILAGDDVDPLDLAAALVSAEELAEPVDVEDLIEKAKAAREEAEARREEERKKRAVTKSYATDGQIHTTDVDIFTGKSFDPFSDYAPATWQATQKQVSFLLKLGVQAKTATAYTKRQAGAVIDKLTSRTGGEFIVTFGKHAGKPLASIPKGYLSWMVNSVSRDDVKNNIRLYLDTGSN